MIRYHCNLNHKLCWLGIGGCFLTLLAPYEKSKSLGSGESTVVRLKLKDRGESGSPTVQNFYVPKIGLFIGMKTPQLQYSIVLLNRENVMLRDSCNISMGTNCSSDIICNNNSDAIHVEYKNTWYTTYMNFDYH